MKNYLTRFFVFFLLQLCFGVVVFAQAESAMKLELVGSTEHLPAPTKDELTSILGSGVNASDQDFVAVLQQAQNALNARHPNTYVLTSTVEGDSRVVRLNVLLGEVLVDAPQGSGFSKTNILASVPSLRAGAVLVGGQDWVDVQEINQANDNPLKLTTVTFEVSPGKPVTAKLTARAPIGSTQSVAAVDNYGTGENRERLSYFYTNANTFGGDEVLRIFALAGLEDSFDFETNSLGLSYSMPFYSLGQSLLISATHSRAASDEVPSLLRGTPFSFALRGDSNTLNVQWAKDFEPWRGIGVSNNTPKATLGLSWRRYANKSTLAGAVGSVKLADISMVETPISVGISNGMRFSPQTNLSLSLLGSWFRPRGESERIKYREVRAGSESGYILLNYTALFNSELGGFPVSAEIIGQYTKDKLTPNNQGSVAGFNAVRGLANPATSLSGDRVFVTRLQANTPIVRVGQQGSVQGFGFFDFGQKSGGTSETQETVSSVGLGVDYRIPASGVSLNGYAAQVLSGRKENNQRSPSFWVKTQVQF